MDWQACQACGACVSGCPYGLRRIAGSTWTVEDAMEVVLADRIFYDESQGGVTLSGGEPLFQPDFALGLLQSAKRHGLHTAVDTCGAVPPSVVAAAAQWTDLFLYDIKTLDPETHRKQTGVSVDLPVANLRRLNRLGKELWIRIPIIPGVNDDIDSLADIIALAATLERVQCVSMLPYHSGGEGKRARLGLPSGVHLEPLSLDRIENLIRTLRPLLPVPLTVGGSSS